MNIETIKRLQARTSARRFRATCKRKRLHTGNPCGWVMRAKTREELERMMNDHDRFQAHA